MGQATDPHAGHDMTAPVPAPPVAPPPPDALSGTEHAADTIFGADAMAPARETLQREHGAMRHHLFLVDRLEASLRDGEDGYAWEGVQLRYGGDIDRLWLKSRGEGAFGGDLEQAEVQALWSHAIDPWFDLQAGVRYDFAPDPERAYLVLGLQGLAPYWFEIDAAAFLSEKGDVTARIEAEYDLRITQRLILQPALELELALQDVPELAIGAGLSSAEAGLRLRYEIVPEFAPYVGVEYERALGDSADFARAAGEDVGGWALVIGTRLWF
jgi:copper resistance protein B